MSDATTITTIQTTTFGPHKDPYPPASKSATLIILLSVGGAIFGIFALAWFIEFYRSRHKHRRRGLVLPLENIVVPGIDAPAAYAGEGEGAAPNSPPPQYTRGMRIKGCWRMKMDDWRSRMKDWKDTRKMGDDHVEMGGISRADVEPLSMQAGLIGPSRVHTRRERC